MAGKTILRAKRTFAKSLSRLKGEERAKRMVDTSGAISIRADGMICEVRENDVDKMLAPANMGVGDMEGK